MVIYVVDAAGHGVGSALLSVSVLNVLRSQSLSGVNFSEPARWVAFCAARVWMSSPSFGMS
ncbi:MAG: SpoIIE family protein phosphatase [Hormoscilla sp. GUM202]|nr:SpoIIE family protein phosphatase [Hormoscilla sp. GUM202]